MTLCQIRTAANAYLGARELPRAARRRRIEDAAHIISLQQQRNAKARRAHRKRTLAILKQLGVDFRKLRRCKLE